MKYITTLEHITIKLLKLLIQDDNFHLRIEPVPCSIESFESQWIIFLAEAPFGSVLDSEDAQGELIDVEKWLLGLLYIVQFFGGAFGNLAWPLFWTRYLAGPYKSVSSSESGT